ncbi:hypothetical protein RI054_39g143660 [Pseudoscourfieldia marina]
MAAFLADPEKMMFEFKVTRCPRTRAHEWTLCPYAHAGEKAARTLPGICPLRSLYTGLDGVCAFEAKGGSDPCASPVCQVEGALFALRVDQAKARRCGWLSCCICWVNVSVHDDALALPAPAELHSALRAAWKSAPLAVSEAATRRAVDVDDM